MLPKTLKDCSKFGEAMNPKTIIVPFETFMESYAPFNPHCSNFMKDVEKELEKTGLIVDGVCKYFQPEIMNELDPYDPLATLCDTISQTAYKDRSVVCKFEHRSTYTTSSRNDGSWHKIDAYFRPIETTVQLPPTPQDPEYSRLQTADIAVNCEWKPFNRDLYDNRLKTVAGAVHVLNSDLRRNHVYSITIEDSDMSLWYWSRSHSVKSDPIDISKDTDQVIRALSCFIFASMLEMGYDDNIRRCYDTQTKRYCYVFWLHRLKRCYKSIRVIDEVCASGCYTAVYEVVEVIGFDNIIADVNAPHLVLKSAWVEKHRPTDKDIQRDIFGSLDRIRQNHTHSALELDETAWKDLSEPLMNYHQYFMTIEACETGAETKEVPIDEARCSSDLFSLKSVPLRSAGSAGEDISRSQLEPVETKAEVPVLDGAFPVKHRVLTLFAEVCKDLRGLDSMVTVLETMQQCLIGLQLMHIAGWIHRDISCGNLLHYEGRGILSDLEYAKKIWPLQRDGSDDSQSQDAHLVPALGPDPKTGTPPFMAVEIIEGFRLAPENLDVLSRIQIANTPVKHWYHHDLESFFWLLFWFLARRADNPRAVRLRNGVGGTKKGAFTEKEVAISVASASTLDPFGLQLIEDINELLLQDCRLHNQDFVPWFHREFNPTTGKLRVNGQIADVIRRRPQYAEMNKTLEALKAPVQKVEKSRLDQFVDLPMIQPGKSVRRKRSSSLEDDRNPPKNRVMSDGVDANRKLK